jgi:hypothetical protein
MAAEERKEPIIIKVTKSSDYKPLYATGVFGGLSALEGRILFFIDRPVPRAKESPVGAMETAEIERELQVEMHMSSAAFLNMYHWMKGHVERLEKLGLVAQVKEEKAE